MFPLQTAEVRGLHIRYQRAASGNNRYQTRPSGRVHTFMQIGCGFLHIQFAWQEGHPIRMTLRVRCVFGSSLGANSGYNLDLNRTWTGVQETHQTPCCEPWPQIGESTLLFEWSDGEVVNHKLLKSRWNLPDEATIISCLWTSICIWLHIVSCYFFFSSTVPPLILFPHPPLHLSIISTHSCT